MDNVEEVFAEEVIVDPPVAEDEEEELDDDEDEDDDEDDDPEDEEEEDEVENPAQVAQENAANGVGVGVGEGGANGDGVNEENAPNPNEENDDGVIDGGLVTEIAHFTADERRSSAFMVSSSMCVCVCPVRPVRPISLSSYSLACFKLYVKTTWHMTYESN